MKLIKLYTVCVLSIIISGCYFSTNYLINAKNLDNKDVELDPDIYKIEVNENGDTYGTYEIDENGEIIEPDLMAVIGLDDVEGYVRRVDLYDEANQPNNPEEAIAYMKKREKEGPRIIPVYKEDGKTIIGKFKID
ncbi:hypothetical protein ACQQ2T_10095 [Paraclostridium tenue]|nr:hypothetical protein [Paeniclostridium sordellii]